MRGTSTIWDSESLCYEPKPLFVLTEVKDSKHNRILRAYGCISMYIMCFKWIATPSLPVIARISKVLFDLQAHSKLVQHGDQTFRLHLVHIKPIIVDGRGLFLRGHSQETPSPLLSFLLFSLAAPACPLLSFLISMAGAACTPSRDNFSFSGPHSLMHLPRPVPSYNRPIHSKAQIR